MELKMTTNQEVIKMVADLYDIECFKCKAFTDENGVVVESYVAFYLHSIETEYRRLVLREIENGFLAENNELLKEVNCSINALSGIFTDITEQQKRRIACVLPFMGGKASVVTSEAFGFTKETKKKMKVLTAKFVGRVSEYMKLEDLMTKQNAPLAELQEKKKACYASARTILQNFYDVVVGEKYCNAKNADCKEVIHALQVITLEKEEKRLVSSPETMGKTMALLLKVCGNTLSGKIISKRYESKVAKAIVEADADAKAKEEKKNKEKDDAEKAELKAERKAAEKEQK